MQETATEQDQHETAPWIPRPQIGPNRPNRNRGAPIATRIKTQEVHSPISPKGELGKSSLSWVNRVFGSLTTRTKPNHSGESLLLASPKGSLPRRFQLLFSYWECKSPTTHPKKDRTGCMLLLFCLNALFPFSSKLSQKLFCLLALLFLALFLVPWFS